MDNFLDKAQEKVEEAQREDQEAAGGKSKQSYANEPDPGQGSGEVAR
jgi:hypothetical protein